MSGWQAAFQNLSREHDFEPLESDGRLPRELRGTLFRNGAALFTLFGRRYRHWFDGDGAVSAVRFVDGRALGAVRLVRTPGLENELRAGRAMYGVLGTLGQGFRRFGFVRGKNPANTSVLYWRDRLFALCEGGLPVEISPEDLATVGEDSLGGVLHANFTAHPHYVPARQTWFGFGLEFGLTTRLHAYALPDRGAARRLPVVPLRFPTLLHDFAATENYLVFFVSPVRARWWPFLAGLRPFVECLEWAPREGTEILVLPTAAPDRWLRFRSEPFFQWHFANAFERSGELVVDFVRYPDSRSIRTYGQHPAPAADSAVWRAVLDPRAGKLRAEPVWNVACEFPRIAPDRSSSAYRFLYLAAPDAVVKLDLETGKVDTAAFGSAVSEPVFVPKAAARAEDDGFLLTMVFDPATARSGVAVLDARSPAAGPLGTAWFNHHIPPTFHGAWVPVG